MMVSKKVSFYLVLLSSYENQQSKSIFCKEEKALT